MTQTAQPHDSFIADATVLLFPRIWSVQDRKDLLMQAFFTNHRWILHQIEVDGPADLFAAHCLQQLLERDCSLVEQLLMTMHRSEGEATRTAIQYLVARLPEFCASQPPAPLSTSPPVAPESPDKTYPTVFISYTDDDVRWAERLRQDLARHGHACFLSPSRQNENEWLAATAEGLSQSYAVIVVVGSRTRQDRWVQVELLAALDKRKKILPFLVGTYPLPVCLPDELQVISGDTDYEAGVAQLLSRLPAPPPVAVTTWTALDPRLLQRAAELVYMDHLKLAELKHVAQYTRLSGTAQRYRSRSDRLTLKPIVTRPEFTHRPWRQGEAEVAEVRRFEDAVAELKAIRRAVLLGEPGAGKTTTLYRLAADLIDTALLDVTAPVPLMVRLGTWVDADEPFEAFLGRTVGELAQGLESRLKENRAVLLLDGLNEIPVQQQANRYKQLNGFLAKFSDLMVIASCREQDFLADRLLSLDRVTVSPLNPVQVYEFIHNYLDPLYGETISDELFWQLAGVQAEKAYHRFVSDISGLEDPFTTFWLAQNLPNGLIWNQWESWLRNRTRPVSLLFLVLNPYLLFMLLDVYQTQGKILPANRGKLLEQFVESLLLRERLLGWDDHTHTVVRLSQGATLLTCLSNLALAMQKQRGKNKDTSDALTALPLHKASAFLNERQKYQAASANLIAIGNEIRFAHHLLQEYFAARYIQTHLQTQILLKRPWTFIQIIWQKMTKETPLSASTVWPQNKLGEATNWEETIILLAGLYVNDCTPVLNWIASVNPELASRCIIESGAYTPEETKRKLRELWMEPLKARPLGRVYLANGMPLDNRSGIGVKVHEGIKIPDIAWGEIVPHGTYTIGGDENAYESFDKQQVHIHRAFRIARYPVTFVQFECFINALDVDDSRWWANIPTEEKSLDSVQHISKGTTEKFPFSNCPRESVSWYQAAAFCRWLSNRLGYEVSLPHEYEWEVAARYPDSRFFPWGNDFDRAKANTNESFSHGLVPVGLYPEGVNEQLGLHDLSGNVFEWCQNKYKYPDEVSVDSTSDERVLRGGSWDHGRGLARVAARLDIRPNNRHHLVGFRLVRRL